MNFHHFIITRFNIPFMNNDNVLFLFTEEYLDRRYTLFLKYCFPSIRQQTCQQFTWLVFFDQRTPQKFRQLNQQLHNEYPNFCPVYIDMDATLKLPLNPYYSHETSLCHPDPAKSPTEQRYEDEVGHNQLPQIWDKAMRAHLAPDEKIIVTSRIDNDDAFEQDMISRVQACITPDVIDKVICFDEGLQFDDSHQLLQTYNYERSHFMSYIETIDNPIKTIFYWNHYYICDYKEIIHYNDKPSWLEVVHGGNASNVMEFKHKNRLLWHYDLSNFGIKKKISAWKTLLNLLASPNAYLKPKLPFWYKAKKRTLHAYFSPK